MSHLLIVPVVTGGCAAGSAGGYNWEATPSGETASVACHEGYSGSATRACVDDEWGTVDDTGCSIEYVAFFILQYVTRVVLVKLEVMNGKKLFP